MSLDEIFALKHQDTPDIHEQTRIKVNAFVDRAVAPLVEALNELPEVLTCSSCEGHGNDDAWVGFVVGNSTEQLTDYVGQLSKSLGKSDTVNDLPFKLSIEWYAGANTPAAYLRVPRQHISEIALAIKKIANAG